MPDLTGKTLGKYHVVRLLGQGGMASVYLAHDETSGSSVALKVLSPLLAENHTFLLRFRREAKVVLRLRHPNIVPVVGFGEERGYAYLAMRYVDGGTLADRLRREPLKPAEAEQVVGQVAAALQHAHDLGIIHRDVKPSNILLDLQGSALLSDFGLAQIQDASISLTGSAMLGTPAYVSPEQIRGEQVDGRADQYALGIVLFQIATGRLPFEAETPLAILARQATEPLPRPSSLTPNLPRVVEDVILKATAKDPGDRFRSIAEMDRAFQLAMAHARNPARFKAPTIELPPLDSARVAGATAPATGRRSVSRLLLAGILGTVLLIVAALALRPSTLGPQGPGGPPAEDLTHLQETIAALSTAVAAAGGGLSPDAIATAVAATLGGPSPVPGLRTPTHTPSETAPAATRRPAASPTPSPAETSTPAPTRAEPTEPPTPTPAVPIPTLPIPTLPLPTGLTLPGLSFLMAAAVRRL